MAGEKWPDKELSVRNVINSWSDKGFNWINVLNKIISSKDQKELREKLPLNIDKKFKNLDNAIKKSIVDNCNKLLNSKDSKITEEDKLFLNKLIKDIWVFPGMTPKTTEKKDITNPISPVAPEKSTSPDYWSALRTPKFKLAGVPENVPQTTQTAPATPDQSSIGGKKSTAENPIENTNNKVQTPNNKTKVNTTTNKVTEKKDKTTAKTEAPKQKTTERQNPSRSIWEIQNQINSNTKIPQEVKNQLLQGITNIADFQQTLNDGIHRSKVTDPTFNQQIFEEKSFRWDVGDGVFGPMTKKALDIYLSQHETTAATTTKESTDAKSGETLKDGPTEINEDIEGRKFHVKDIVEKGQLKERSVDVWFKFLGDFHIEQKYDNWKITSEKNSIVLKDKAFFDKMKINTLGANDYEVTFNDANMTVNFVSKNPNERKIISGSNTIGETAQVKDKAETIDDIKNAIKQIFIPFDSQEWINKLMNQNSVVVNRDTQANNTNDAISNPELKKMNEITEANKWIKIPSGIKWWEYAKVDGQMVARIKQPGLFNKAYDYSVFSKEKNEWNSPTPDQNIQIAGITNPELKKMGEIKTEKQWGTIPSGQDGWEYTKVDGKMVARTQNPDKSYTYTDFDVKKNEWNTIQNPIPENLALNKVKDIKWAKVGDIQPVLDANSVKADANWNITLDIQLGDKKIAGIKFDANGECASAPIKQNGKEYGFSWNKGENKVSILESPIAA